MENEKTLSEEENLLSLVSFQRKGEYLRITSSTQVRELVRKSVNKALELLSGWRVSKKDEPYLKTKVEIYKQYEDFIRRILKENDDLFDAPMDKIQRKKRLADRLIGIVNSLQSFDPYLSLVREDIQGILSEFVIDEQEDGEIDKEKKLGYIFSLHLISDLLRKECDISKTGRKNAEKVLKRIEDKVTKDCILDTLIFLLQYIVRYSLSRKEDCLKWMKRLRDLREQINMSDDESEENDMILSVDDIEKKCREMIVSFRDAVQICLYVRKGVKEVKKLLKKGDSLQHLLKFGINKDGEKEEKTLILAKKIRDISDNPKQKVKNTKDLMKMFNKMLKEIMRDWRDDFTIIFGIGKCRQRNLKEIGIKTFQDLRDASTEKLQEARLVGQKISQNIVSYFHS